MEFAIYAFIALVVLKFIDYTINSPKNKNSRNISNPLSQKTDLTKETLPFYKKTYLLTNTEKIFYFVLSEILGNDYLIFSKVRIADLVYLPKGINNSDFYHYQNKVQSKHVDFIICDKENIKPLLVIELDDSSHLRQDRIDRDLLVDKIFRNAKLPIAHVRVSDEYNKDKLLELLKIKLIF
ncbi:MAG: DUF2726 domain-containing protein [Candidatus Moraniibacteriota bacterium]